MPNLQPSLTFGKYIIENSIVLEIDFPILDAKF